MAQTIVFRGLQTAMRWAALLTWTACHGRNHCDEHLSTARSRRPPRRPKSEVMLLCPYSLVLDEAAHEHRSIVYVQS